MTRPADRLTTATIDTPIGPLLLGAAGRSLCLAEYGDKERSERQLRRVAQRLGLEPAPGESEAVDRFTDELAAYFAGELREFATPITLAGTDFQRRVWGELLKIPLGETRSYAQIARALSDENATRAVGAANGANPISLLVPCHRVVRTGGDLGGYGGGLDRKRWLLEHERRAVGQDLFA